MNKQKTKKGINWKEGTIVLSIVCVILFIILFVKTDIQADKLKVELCQATTGVPAYVSIINKEVLFTGYHGVPEPGVINELISRNIAFVYSSGCPYCAKQIEAFGEEWIKYQESGLTVDCSKL